MSIKQRALGPSIIHVALTFAACLLLNAATAGATVQYLSDGAIPDGNGWKLPLQATCPEYAPAGYVPIGAVVTRAECLAMRLNYATSADCTAGGTRSWTTSGVCNDQINTTQAACEAAEDRLWNPSTSICSIIMYGDDRNNVNCAIHQGTWVTTGTCVGAWVSAARDAFDPPLLSGTGPGDQCLRCHNDVTQYNGPRVRDTEDTMYMGHKNMVRKVVPGQAWGGPHPAMKCFVLGVIDNSYTDEHDCEIAGGWWQPQVPYPTDDGGNPIDWETGTITIGGVDRDLLWIYGDWLAPLPRAVYRAPKSATQVCSDPRYTAANCVANGGTLVLNAGISYSCGRCHTTGWTSDADVVASTGIEAKEPEASFPGVSWSRDVDAVDGQVNLAGNVLNDPNQSSSWDVWGIACSRCHNSAIDTTTANTSVPPQYSAPAGMSSHHNNLTVPTGNQCTDPRFTAEAQCTAAGGTWIVATGTASCSVAGICNTLNPADSDATLCAASGGQWAVASDIVRCLDIHNYGKENNIPAYEAARFTGTATNRGQIITRLCMDCHRQETSGVPYANALDANGKGTYVANGDYSLANPGEYLKVGPAHGTVDPVSHPHGNMFLNSPHGRFSGNFNQIATAKLGTGYDSAFQLLGEAANTGNGCTGCHDVHQSTVKSVDAEPIHEECTECHSKNLSYMRHPLTPFGGTKSDPAAPCVTCHMPHGQHLFRINTDEAYSTFPMDCTQNSDCALTSTVNANTADHKGFANAVWTDLDHACGQCHGGGSNFAVSTGTILSASRNVVTVADAAGFARAQRIRVAGAGALEADGVSREDFESYIVSVSGTAITMAGSASVGIANATVEQNPTSSVAPYFDKEVLSLLADGIHGDAPLATFTYTYVPPGTNRLNVRLNASGSSCSGGCTSYEWDFGDGSALGSGATVDHLYATGGIKTVKLTVTAATESSSTVQKTVRVFAPYTDPKPVVGGNDVTSCASIISAPNTWGASILDASTDNAPLKQVNVNWGDGSMMEIKAAGSPFTHTYKKLPPRSCRDAATEKKILTATSSAACATAGGVWDRYFYVVHTAVDNIGQQTTKNCTVQLTPFTISGVVDAAAVPVSGAQVLLKKGTSIVKSALTAPTTGAYSITGVKPGDYTLAVTKAGLTFLPVPVTVGPDATVDISAE